MWCEYDMDREGTFVNLWAVVVEFEVVDQNARRKPCFAVLASQSLLCAYSQGAALHD